MELGSIPVSALMVQSFYSSFLEALTEIEPSFVFIPTHSFCCAVWRNCTYIYAHYS